MTPAPPALSDIASVVCIFSIFLVPFAAAGLALMNTGLGRSKSAAHVLMAAVCILSIAALVYLISGFSWQGYIGRPAHLIHAAHRDWNWLGAEAPFFRGIALDASPVSLAALLQLLTVGLAALIPLGSGADRWRLSASCMSTVLLAGIVYPLFGHWAWSGGWLAQLGFVDAGGSACVQAVGGLTALSITWIIGPRRGKYAMDGMPSAFPGHNAVLVLFACFLSLLGWFGLNTAASILFAGAEPSRIVLIAVNTTVAAAASCLATAGVTRMRFGKPDASLTANGWIGGLAAGSAGCAFFAPAGAVMVGLIAGLIIPFSVEWLESRLHVDDPGGAISVHALGGVWGVLAVGFLGRFPNPNPNVWTAQLIGIATLLGFVLPLAFGLNFLLDKLYPQRVGPEGERQGMDLYELGAGAYPEFITHNEDFYQR